MRCPVLELCSSCSVACRIPTHFAGNGVFQLETIRGGGDTTIPSPGMASKQPLPGKELHDPLHGRLACPESNSFHQGVGQIGPRWGAFSCRPFPKRGQICDITASPQSLNGSTTVLTDLYVLGACPHIFPEFFIFHLLASPPPSHHFTVELHGW